MRKQSRHPAGPSPEPPRTCPCLLTELATGLGLGKPGGWRCWPGAAILGTTRDCPRTLAWGWGGGWSPLSAPSKAKGELPRQPRPAMQGSHRPVPPSSPPTDLPSCRPPPPPHRAQVCFAREPAGRSVFPHRTAWLGRCSSRLIYSQAPRPHALQRCLPRLPACLPDCHWGFSIHVYIYPEAVGIMARPEIALKTFT